jgi:hypothetical protein
VSKILFKIPKEIDDETPFFIIHPLGIACL